MAASALLFIVCLGTAHAWGGLFNRFSSDMLANMGYGRSPYHHYAYGQVEPEEIYAEALEGNRIQDADDSHCYSAPCITNGDCCRELMCLETGLALNLYTVFPDDEINDTGCFGTTFRKL